MKSRTLTSEEILRMRDHVMNRQRDPSPLFTQLSSSDTDATTTTTVIPFIITTIKPDEPGPACRITSYVKNKFKNIKDWCTNCFDKAKKVVKGVFGLDKSKSDELVYRSNDDITELV